MGAWGTKAWENDPAMDWYEQLFEETKLAGRISDTLMLDTESYPDEI